MVQEWVNQSEDKFICSDDIWKLGSYEKARTACVWVFFFGMDETCFPN